MVLAASNRAWVRRTAVILSAIQVAPIVWTVGYPIRCVGHEQHRRLVHLVRLDACPHLDVPVAHWPSLVRRDRCREATTRASDDLAEQSKVHPGIQGVTCTCLCLALRSFMFSLQRTADTQSHGQAYPPACPARRIHARQASPCSRSWSQWSWWASSPLRWPPSRSAPCGEWPGTVSMSRPCGSPSARWSRYAPWRSPRSKRACSPARRDRPSSEVRAGTFNGETLLQGSTVTTGTPLNPYRRTGGSTNPDLGHGWGDIHRLHLSHPLLATGGQPRLVQSRPVVDERFPRGPRDRGGHLECQVRRRSNVPDLVALLLTNRLHVNADAPVQRALPAVLLLDNVHGRRQRRRARLRCHQLEGSPPKSFLGPDTAG